jgi:hypothetical protein
MAATRFVIMPPAWAESDTHVCRTLGRGKKGETPLVAIARVENGQLAFVPKAGLGPGDVKALVAAAQAHLEAQTTSWDVSEMSGGFLGFFKKPTLVAATGGVDMELMMLAKDRPRYGLTMQIAGVVIADDYAPERVLSPAAMAAAHQLLGTPSVIAVFPKRGMLLVGPGQPGEFPAMIRMNQAAKGIHDRAGEAAVCAHGYFLNDGKLVGINGEGYLSLFPTDVDPWGPDW